MTTTEAAKMRSFSFFHAALASPLPLREAAAAEEEAHLICISEPVEGEGREGKP